MPLFFLILIFLNLQLFADGVANDEQYYTKDIKNTQIIYTEQNREFANETASIEAMLHPQYEESFHWKLDEKLYVGLMSESNQIANGYSTQFPNNRQINFPGGALQVDYFSTTSWLKTLLYHETAHNYQGNVKASVISQGLHSIFGNGSFYGLLPITYPNLLVSSFFLEGNAVLNESLHGNGGRLWSGRFKAETILQARAGYITPSRTYNEHLYFPYREHHYIVGGFFFKFLAEKYGLKKANAYFREHSYNWYWPFLTNSPMDAVFDKDFEDLIKEFSNDLRSSSADFKMAEGDILAHSQFFSQLNRDENTIFFITNESGRGEPSFVNYEIDTGKLSEERRTFKAGKVIKYNKNFYTQASHTVTAEKVYQGLFDDEANIKRGSEGKVVQGYLSDGREVYFDVATSFDQPQLYVGKEFYTQVNSSVIIDKEDNLYYFVQSGDRRVLYKNREKIVSFRAYYSIVSDVADDGSIFFVANSKLGSTLYCYKDGTLTRVVRADNVVEAKLIDDNTFLVAAISADDYYYVKTQRSFDIEVPYFEELKVEAYESNVSKTEYLTLKDEYSALKDMHYSGLDFAYSSTDAYNLNLSLADPLVQNSLNFYINRADAEEMVGGISYLSTKYLVSYALSLFSLLESNSSKSYDNFYGVSAYADYRFLRRGYYSADLVTTYYQGLSTSREPLAVELALKKMKSFGVSKYAQEVYSASIYATKERENSFYGTKLSAQKDIYDESYLSLLGQYSYAVYNTYQSYGIKVNSNLLSLDNDPSKVTMPSYSEVLYLKDVLKAGAEFKQVFNFSHYYFTFPVSLRREVLSMGYNKYIFNTASSAVNVNEYFSGLTTELLFFNKVSIDLNFTYYNNDIYKQTDQFRLTFGLNL